MSKPPNTHERNHMDRVARLGCICCLRDNNPGTPAQVHHIRQGQGMSQRAGHWLVLPLCERHHLSGPYSIHGGPSKFKMRYGEELGLLDEVLERIYGD